MSSGEIVIVSGFSGVGKGTVIRELLSRHKEFTFSVSATTRAPREGEQDGKDYFFISREEFEKWIREDRFLEYARYVDNSYGTPRDYVQKRQDEGFHVILDIEIQGALRVKELCPDARMVFLIPPSAEALHRRIAGRGTETKESIRKRLSRAIEEADYVHLYDNIIINDSLTDCVEALRDAATRHGTVAGDRLAKLRLVEDIKNDLIQIVKGEM